MDKKSYITQSNYAVSFYREAKRNLYYVSDSKTYRYSIITSIQALKNILIAIALRFTDLKRIEKEKNPKKFLEELLELTNNTTHLSHNQQILFSILRKYAKDLKEIDWTLLDEEVFELVNIEDTFNYTQNLLRIFEELCVSLQSMTVEDTGVDTTELTSKLGTLFDTSISEKDGNDILQINLLIESVKEIIDSYLIFNNIDIEGRSYQDKLDLLEESGVHLFLLFKQYSSRILELEETSTIRDNRIETSLLDEYTVAVFMQYCELRRLTYIKFEN